jgi:hypothetical protein
MEFFEIAGETLEIGLNSVAHTLQKRRFTVAVKITRCDSNNDLEFNDVSVLAVRWMMSAKTDGSAS